MRKEFMAGLSFVASGDLRQLPPIHDQLITEKSRIDARPQCAKSYWDDHFQIYYLTEKMRCKDDDMFAELCDRIGQGQLKTEDEEFLKSRVQSTPLEDHNDYFKTGKISIVVTTNRRREEINIDKLEKLLPNEKTYKCFSTDRVMNVSKAHDLPDNLPYTQTGQLPPQLHIKVGAPVVITTNHSKSVYKEDGMMNGARGYIDYIEVNKEDPEEVEIIWVVMNHKESCAKYRSDY